jgi:hypothetical protein
MLPFRDFTKLKKTSEGYIIVDDPVSFKQDHYSINEDVDRLELAKQYNFTHHKVSPLGDDSSELMSFKLHSATANNLNDEESNHILNYTKQTSKEGKSSTGSSELNYNLVNNLPLTDEQQAIHDTIMRHAKPSGYEFHLFSGTSRNFEDLAKHTKDNIFHFPAHTSMTHDFHTASDFAIRKRKSRGLEPTDYLHMIDVHIKPYDKLLHISQYSRYPNEGETILPARTNLQYIGSSTHSLRSTRVYRAHHFTIHSQQ